MTDRPAPPGGHAADPPDHPDHPDRAVVEAASAFVDGHLTAAEQERFVDDARFEAVADRFGRLRKPLNSVPAPNASLRNEHLAAALAAFDATLDRAELPSYEAQDSVIASLDEARRRRARRLVPALAVAAALALVGLVIGSVASRSGTSNDVTAVGAIDTRADVRQKDQPEIRASEATIASVDAVPADTRPMAAAAVAPAVSTDDAQVAAGSADAESLPVLSSPRQLVAAVRTLLDQQTGAPNGARTTNPCPGITGVVLTRVRWIDHLSLLIVSPSAEQPTDVLVVQPDSCAVEASATLGG
jgi:hypothetical protein